MQLTHLALLLSITLAPSLSQTLNQNAVKSLIQGILSPKNTEQVMQIVSAVANTKSAPPNVPRPVNRRFAITDNVPRSVMRTEAPNKMAQLVLRPEEMCMKKNVLVKNSNNVIVPNDNQMVLPKNMVVQRRTEPALPRNLIVRKNEMPKNMVVQSNDYDLRVPQMITPEVVQQKVFINPQMRPEVQQKVFISEPQTIEYVTVPQQKVLICNDNPFLPAASPISALAAFSSSSLPPAMPQSRGQFLRKIPIPPPTL